MGFYQDKSKKNVSAVPPIIQNVPGISAKETAIIPKPDEGLTKKKYVINTMNNATSVNTTRLATVVADLKGFAEGSAVTVTYYKEHYSETDITGKNETEAEIHNVHKSTLKIHNFELRMLNSLQYEHNTTETISKITGEALTYPGFQPEKDDMFVMEVDTGKYGLMKVMEVPTRMSIRASTYYKITFMLDHWMSEGEAEALEEAVVDEAWFDKTRFLSEPGALLYHDEYVEMKFLTKERLKLINFYKGKFLDEIMMYSYMRPDDVYDPYVTDFMQAILDFTESAHMATQLYENAPYLKSSIWSALKDECLPLQMIPTSTDAAVYKLGSKSVLANSLINKTYLYWKDSQSLQDYLDAQIAADAQYVVQLYPADFKVVSSAYQLTTDTTFKYNKTYYTKSGDDSHTAQTTLTAAFLADKQYSYLDGTTYKVLTPVTSNPTTYEYVPGTTLFGEKDYTVYLDNPITYTVARVHLGDAVPADTFYELISTYTWKDNTTYYTRTDGKFTAVDQTVVTTPDPTATYYVKTTSSSSSSTTTEGVIPADSTIPAVTEGTTDQESTLGDALLHAHPHYAECPWVSGSSGSTETTGEGLGYVLDGTNDHIDLIREFLTKRTINLLKLHSCIENVWKLSDIQKFYKMPLYIYLAKVALAYLHGWAGIFER